MIYDKKIIDAHAHIFPEKIAERATAGISDFYSLPMSAPAGDIAHLFEQGEEVSQFVVCSVATVPAQTRAINEFLARSVAENPERLAFLAAAHPDCDDVTAELERALALGARGIKLHSDFQRFAVDDEKAFAIYDFAQQNGLPLLLHAGDDRYNFSNPQKILNVLNSFPRLQVVAAHMGGWSEWDEAQALLAGTGICVDTCSTTAFVSPAQMLDMISTFGEDNVLFGTDFPMWSTGDEVRRLEKIGLSHEAEDKIFYKNAERIYLQ